MILTINKKTYEAGELVAYVEQLEKEKAELKETVIKMNNVITETFSNLIKAKKIIEELYNIIPASMADYAKEPMEHARKFMTEEADE